MITYTKDSLIHALRDIAASGWHQARRDTRGGRNDGAAGNLLEDLLGIEENNLPLPNANEWELKVQRRSTNSHLTLKHLEPSPRAMRFVQNVLLPNYGWPHQSAGGKYPTTERSFRQTVSGNDYSSRGFKIEIEDERISLSFNAAHVKPEHEEWLDDVERRVGNLSDLDPRPYWGLADLTAALSSKLNNAFFVVADNKRVNGHEFFRFGEVHMLSGFSITGYLDLLRQGTAYVDFDARTGHNHGTKFRVRPTNLPSLYGSNDLVVPHVDVAIDI